MNGEAIASMNQITRLKDSVFGFFTPKPIDALPAAKRRRTIGLGTPSKDLTAEHVYEPISEPRGEKAQAALHSRLSKKYFSSSIRGNPLKRSREDDGNDNERLDDVQEGLRVNSTDHTENGDDLSPGDSSSQVTPNYDEDEEEDREDRDEEEYDEENEDNDDPIDEEATAREKVEEYLARQAELALKRDVIAEVKQQGTWHPDEVFLFERLSLRSFEALIPQEWQIDFGTLPEDLFHQDKDKVLINHNCLTAFRGKSSTSTFYAYI